MRISDWSSDVCSSDLQTIAHHHLARGDRQIAANRVIGAGRRWRPGEFAAEILDRVAQAAREVGATLLQRPLEHHRVGRQQVARRKHVRSEEHTSELQSLMRNSYAVFCLKKTKKKYDGQTV